MQYRRERAQFSRRKFAQIFKIFDVEGVDLQDVMETIKDRIVEYHWAKGAAIDLCHGMQ